MKNLIAAVLGMVLVSCSRNENYDQLVEYAYLSKSQLEIGSYMDYYSSGLRIDCEALTAELKEKTGDSLAGMQRLRLFLDSTLTFITENAAIVQALYYENIGIHVDRKETNRKESIDSSFAANELFWKTNNRKETLIRLLRGLFVEFNSFGKSISENIGFLSPITDPGKNYGFLLGRTESLKWPELFFTKSLLVDSYLLLHHLEHYILSCYEFILRELISKADKQK